MLTSIFQNNFHKKKRFGVSRQGQPQPHVQSKARILSSQLYSLAYCVIYIESCGDKICHVKLSKM